MKEFSDSLPASELEHLWLNMFIRLRAVSLFNYFRKYICVDLHFTCNEEIFIQHTKNNNFKNQKNDLRHFKIFPRIEGRSF